MSAVCSLGYPGCDAGPPLPAARAGVPPALLCEAGAWGPLFFVVTAQLVAGPWELPGNGDRLAGNTSRRYSSEGLWEGGASEEYP